MASKMSSLLSSTPQNPPLSARTLPECTPIVPQRPGIIQAIGRRSEKLLAKLFWRGENWDPALYISTSLGTKPINPVCDVLSPGAFVGIQKCSSQYTEVIEMPEGPFVRLLKDLFKVTALSNSQQQTRSKPNPLPSGEQTSQNHGGWQDPNSYADVWCPQGREYVGIHFFRGVPRRVLCHYRSGSNCTKGRRSRPCHFQL